MKECINCKAQLEDDELFCHECGTKQVIEQPEAQAEEQSVPEGMRCSHCGEAIEKDSLFCPYCGKPQDVEETKSEKPRPEAEEPKREETQTEEPQVKEEQNVKESSKKESPKEETQVEEEPEYELEENKKSRVWIGILLALLIAGGAVGYYLMNHSSSETAEENVEASDSINTSPVIDENAPTNALAFLNQFYKGKIGDDYIREYVTANVINKLRRDFDYDCPSNDCLATWVFTAYPAGADLDLEEGPMISATDKEGVYEVKFKYSGYSGEEKKYEIRTVFLTVTEIEGKYLICDYEVGDGIEEKEGLLAFEDALRIAEEMQIKDGVVEGFRSPENVNKIMKEYGYEHKGKYFVDRQMLFGSLYYKNCTLAESTGNDCYTDFPSANGGRDASFVGLDDKSLVIAPFSKADFDGFLKQVKEKGATLVENDESTIIYKYSTVQITGFKRGVFSLNYCIFISKEE